MPASIGVNLRVTGHCSQGGRKYMEDFFSVAYQQSLSDERDLEYAFIGIYDGHGGSEAATFAKEHLINLIVNQKLFWSNDDREVLRAIREGYIATHYAMWREQEKWPKTATGLPSTAGTTASVAFIRHGKIYIGHVGDSGIVLGYQDDDGKRWSARQLTRDHKPECDEEKARIINSGGKVVTKSGVPRVVWNRPRLGHKGPVRRSTPIDEIPFLAVARSLGDLWSYNSALNEFVVSPEPDARVVKIDPKRFRCLIFGTDGLWNVLSAQTAVDNVRLSEMMNERNVCLGGTKEWTNPSKNLVDRALERWSNRKMRADNTSVVIIMLDPPGPPKRDVLKTCSPQQYSLDYLSHADTDDEHVDALRTETGLDGSATGSNNADNFTMFDHRTNQQIDLDDMPMPTSGLAIMTPAYDHIPVVGDFVTDKHHAYHMNHVATDTSLTNSSTEVPFMNSFAESYNSLLNSSLEHDQSYIYNGGDSDDAVADLDDEDYDEDSGDGSHHFASQHQLHSMPIDTYSLTKLQTRSEQQIDLYGGESSSSSTSSSASSSSSSASSSIYNVYSHNLLDHNYIDTAHAALHRQQTIHQHYQALSSTSYGIPLAATSSFRLAHAEQPLPAMESILHDLHNSTNYYEGNQKVLIDPNDITIISNCSEESQSAVAVECLNEINYAFQPDYEGADEELSTVDLTICPATDITIEIDAIDDSIQINEISSSGNNDGAPIDEMNDKANDNDCVESLPSPQPSSPPSSPVKAVTPTTAALRIVTRSSQSQPAGASSPRVTRSTDKRAITKQSEKKRRQVALKAKIDAIIQKRSTTNSSGVAGGNETLVAQTKFHKENISNARKLRKNVVAETLTAVTNIRTRNASIRIPSPSTLASTQRTLRSQNTVARDRSQQSSVQSRTDAIDAMPTTSAANAPASKQSCNHKTNSSTINKQLNLNATSSTTNNNNSNSSRSNGNYGSSGGISGGGHSINNNSNSISCSVIKKQPKRLTDAVQIVKNDNTKLKNVQPFLSPRQLRDAKLVALNNVSTIRCKMMLTRKSIAVLPSRCSNGSSFLGDVERTMITRRTRLHH